MIKQTTTTVHPQRPGAAQDDNCTICLEPLDLTCGNLARINPCSHTFHETCIQRWRESNNSSHERCPNCRNLISVLHKLNETGEIMRTIPRPVVYDTPLGNNEILTNPILLGHGIGYGIGYGMNLMFP